MLSSDDFITPQKLTCPTCLETYLIDPELVKKPPLYCPFCGCSIKDPQKNRALSSDESSTSDITITQDHIPRENDVLFSIGPYQVIQSIGKGGMGEVFIAYDTTCGRRIALKRIREDYGEQVQLYKRFLKEARVTSQLTHPAIIPIHSIHGKDKPIYYTMPYVQGDTLKQVLRKARQKERKGEKLDHLEGSIPALTRIFLTICQAVAYAHSKKVLHRDLKPENVIIGHYGEVQILDWGLAKLVHDESELSQDSFEIKATKGKKDITRLGKVVGTISYMAPERALGKPATYQTDIYSLGVILYQILTLKTPFARGTLEEFRKSMPDEVLYDPAEVAPYRDVPRLLAKISMKCLEAKPEQRYATVQEIIHDLENYIEGRSEWFQMAKMDITDKEVWEFQENVLIGEHIAITRSAEVTDWVSLMISKASFADNTKVEAKIRIGEKGHGIGFLLSIPEATERVHLNDGYCLWLGSELNKSTKLLRSTVEVIQAPEIALKQHEWYDIRIEKIDNNLYFYLNNTLQFSYISHLPIVGTHIGLLSRDADFEIKDFFVFIAGQNITVNCLAVPDAFLAHKNYAAALSEYRRIGYSFTGRAEGREAMFRAGITLMEQARNFSDPKEATHLYDLALSEFEKLHNTPGAPLEYLGKALVYQATKEYEEEIKCFELAYRRYPKHPLLPVIQEQIVYRMNVSSRLNRKAAYNFVLLTLMLLPSVAQSHHAKKLFHSLQTHWEPLPFIIRDDEEDERYRKLNFSLQLCFWLSKPYVIYEIIAEIMNTPPFYCSLFSNALFSLIELGSWKLARQALEEFSLSKYEEKLGSQLEVCRREASYLNICIICHESGLKESLKALDSLQISSITPSIARILLHLVEYALTHEKAETMHQLAETYKDLIQTEFYRFQITCYQIWAYMLERDWDKAKALLHSFPYSLLIQDTSILHFLYGCWLYVTEGKEIADIHFSGILEISYPPTWALFSYFLNGQISENNEWQSRVFSWEKRHLYRQLILFYHCINDPEKKHYYQHLEKLEYHDIEE